jgi:hypothetical protein
MREVLVQEGVPRERIAILNAEVAKPADRIRIAREFNGLPPESPQSEEGCAIRGAGETELAPKYDVVIANSVAYEGVDLQVRTCTIHHLDLPWTPSDLEQRNGRAYRQGNRLGTLEILYYMSKRSLDGFRWGILDGKGHWLGAVLESGRRDTNNPAAQQDLSPEQILLMISRNPAETARRVEEAKKKAIEEERLRVAREAARLMTQASARFRDARVSTDPDKATQLRAEGHVRLRQLRKYDAAAWPWARWIDETERVEYLVPPDGEAPVYEGLRVAIPDAYNPDTIKYFEFGRLVVSDGPPCIGVRTARTARWVCQNLEAVKALGLRPEHMPGGSVPWDSGDEAATRAALGERLEAWGRTQPVDWHALGFTSASDAWLERWWPLAEPRVRESLSVQAEPQAVPVLVGGELRLREGPEVRAGVLMPPTSAGWQQFLALAPTSGETFTDLKQAAELWWARKIPQSLLAAARGEAKDDAPAPSPAGASMMEEEALPVLPTGPDVRRKTARADKPTKKQSSRGKKVAEPVRPRELASMPPAGPTQRGWADRLVDAFNADAGPQLAFSRRRGLDTIVFILHAEERPDRRLAVVDIQDEQLEDIRWLEDLTPAQQTELTERIGRALAQLDPEQDGSLPRATLDKLRARARALGADPERLAGKSGSEEFRWLAETLKDLAEPRGTDGDALAAWLSARSLRSAAQHIRDFASEVPLDDFLAALWEKLEDAIVLVTVERVDGGLVVDSAAIYESDGGPALVLREMGEGGRPREVLVRLREDCEDDRCRIESDELVGGERAWHLGTAWDHAFIRELYRKIHEFERGLRTAPQRLADVREMLFWTAAMIDAPRCQGESRRVAETAFRKAREHYGRARGLIAQGDSDEGLRAIHDALRKIAEAAAELAQSCAEGQTTLLGTAGTPGGERS